MGCGGRMGQSGTGWDGVGQDKTELDRMGRGGAGYVMWWDRMRWGGTGGTG